MLTMRLQRRGRKNDPTFRVILVESKRAAKTGSFNEVLGSYDPHTKQLDLKKERIEYWLSQGVTLSDTLHNMFVSQKLIEGKKINVLLRKSPPQKEEAPEAAPAEVSAEPAAEAMAPAQETATAAEEKPAEENTSAPAAENADEEKGDNDVAAA